MADKAGDLEHLNIVLHGPPGSGKSSFKRAILGRDPLPEEDDAEYAKAMAEGAGDLEHLNIVLHGPPGSGKSSFKRAILGQDPLPKEEQNSTDIMENAVRAVSQY